MSNLPKFDNSVKMMNAVRRAAPKIIAATVGMSPTSQAQEITDFLQKNGGTKRFRIAEVAHQRWIPFIDGTTTKPRLTGIIHAAWEWMRSEHNAVLKEEYRLFGDDKLYWENDEKNGHSIGSIRASSILTYFGNRCSELLSNAIIRRNIEDYLSSYRIASRYLHNRKLIFYFRY